MAKPNQEQAPEVSEHLPTCEDVARALLLFHDTGPWTDRSKMEWARLTGSSECTTKSLCDMARQALGAIID